MREILPPQSRPRTPIRRRGSGSTGHRWPRRCESRTEQGAGALRGRRQPTADAKCRTVAITRSCIARAQTSSLGRGHLAMIQGSPANTATPARWQNPSARRIGCVEGGCGWSCVHGVLPVVSLRWRGPSGFGAVRRGSIKLHVAPGQGYPRRNNRCCGAKIRATAPRTYPPGSVRRPPGGQRTDMPLCYKRPMNALAREPARLVRSPAGDRSGALR
jgi:hypothetical protein